MSTPEDRFIEWYRRNTPINQPLTNSQILDKMIQKQAYLAATEDAARIAEGCVDAMDRHEIAAAIRGEL